MRPCERWPAPGKLNLMLHITGRRPDGYHELQTLFQLLDFGDELEFRVRGDGRVRLRGGLDEVPDGDDLVVRAARALQQATGTRLGCDIRLHKRLPAGAGLGGGSSDAATTLLALDRLWGTGLARERLAGIGLRLGADVPVFVGGRSAWGEGVGERLRPVRLPERWFVVLTPPVRVVTAELFGARGLERDCAPLAPESAIAGAGGNVFEPLVAERHPEVREMLDWLSRHAPARLTGTGASVFAGFDARDAAERVLAARPAGWQGFVARGMNRSPVEACLKAPRGVEMPAPARI